MKLERPDGCVLHWEQQGEGPLVALAHINYSPPSLLDGLVNDLAADHRVLTYHPRGTGDSSRTGPYDMLGDAADLTAIVEAAEGPAIAIALGDGCNRAVRVASERSDLLTRVVIPGPPVFGAPPDREHSDGLAASPPVLGALLQLLDTDYRAGLRTIMQTGNPDLSDEVIRRRVDAIAEYSDHGAAAARMRAWIADDAWAPAAALGERLRVLSHGRNPWFGDAAGEQTRELLPNAHIEAIDDGPFDRPDLTASAVRGLTAVEAS